MPKGSYLIQQHNCMRSKNEKQSIMPTHNMFRPFFGIKNTVGNKVIRR